MNELRIIDYNGLLTVSSRDVAEFVGKTHKNLLRDIRKYEEILLGSKLSPADFFLKSAYTDVTGRELESYQLTKKGCDMVGHKMTGEKGVIFTATYIDTFYKYEGKLKPQIADTSEEIKVRKAELLLKLGDEVKIPEYKQILQSYATKELTGDFLLPLPTVEKRTYSAEEIGNILGISKNKIGRLANKSGIKNEEYGKFFYDKSKYSSKEVETFRYYENAIPVFKELLINKD